VRNFASTNELDFGNWTQRSRVRRFLEFAANHDDSADSVVAQEALDGYWRQAAQSDVSAKPKNPLPA